jgi:hypothetical protein
MKKFNQWIVEHEGIENPNSSGQGYSKDHVNNPHHATILKHGYVYSHSTPVTHLDQQKRVHHTYKHSSLKDHVVGVHQASTGQHKWAVHKLGQGRVATGSGDANLDRHLKGHIGRAKRTQNNY